MEEFYCDAMDTEPELAIHVWRSQAGLLVCMCVCVYKCVCVGKKSFYAFFKYTTENIIFNCSQISRNFFTRCIIALRNWSVQSSGRDSNKRV